MESQTLQEESTSLIKLKGKLREMFQLDRGDLDFGIYRIMNQKREEVDAFLENDLLPQVREAFALYQSADKVELQKELDEKTAQYRADGMDPDTVPRIKELKEMLAQAVDISAIENEVYSDLYNFFRRYYHEGDFISQRRYKEGVYAIPYEGEEVKLYWANHDQYYIKTSENLKTYAFKLPSGKRVRFELAVAGTEQDNVKANNGKERRFILHHDDPASEVNGELIIRFEYRPDGQGRKQEALIIEAVDAIIGLEGIDTWILELTTPAPTEKKPDRNLFEKHLTDYAAKNTFDYFIHKDLGGFLRRELDFFIKNEVMHLDDIESESVPRVEQYLSKLKVLRKIAHKIIAFHEQLENFQKTLWLKKKFVLETHYCITLDRVPEELYSEIAANEAQREEWVRVFSIDELEGYSEPLSEEFLLSYRALMLDTQFYSEDIKSEFLFSIDNIEEALGGVIIHSDNFQALNCLSSCYAQKIHCIYIDPPYNTDATPILYKNGYRHSSWITLLINRIQSAEFLRSHDSILCVAIDDYELSKLFESIDSISDNSHLATVVVRSKPQGRPTATGFSTNHEYAIFWGRSSSTIGRLPRTGTKAERYPHRDNKGIYTWANLRKSGSDSDREDRKKSFYPIYITADSVRIPRMNWDVSNEVWTVLEELNSTEKELWPIDGDRNEKVWTCSAARAKDEIDDIKIIHKPDGSLELHKKYRPNQEGSLPGTWWDSPEYSASESGTKVLKDLFGEKEFDYPKSINLVTDNLWVGNLYGNRIVCDFFAGSGTTGHAVIDLNREDGGQRKYILVEMGEYFDTVLKPRIQKVVYSTDWKDGKPTSRDTGTSHMFKYMRLESYEDALDNLELKRTAEQQDLLDTEETQGADGLREEYLLSYMLDVETRDSPSLLNVEQFKDPWNYELKITRNDEAKRVKVDLVETFNWLLGLRVKTMSRVRGVYVVTGLNPQDEKVLVLWRKLEETNNEKLDDWFEKSQYSTREQEFDLIYVNGDNHLENLRKDEETWKVRLIEQEFKRLMFDVRDV